MPEFHNPYHFVPATGTLQKDGQPQRVETEPFEEIAQGTSTHPARHDRWVPDTHSGRAICRLTLERPTIVGGEQVEDPDAPEHRPKRVEPYRRVVPTGNGGNAHWPAIPGSSLRGMVSAVAEALSQSALRVLGDTQYSVRVKPGRDEKALSALGYLVAAPEEAGRGFDLVPIGLPTLELGQGGVFRLPARWAGVFRDFKWREVLTGYVDRYERQNGETRADGTSFLGLRHPESSSPADDQPDWWYAKTGHPPSLDRRLFDALPARVEVAWKTNLLKIKRDRWLLGLNLGGPTDLIDAQQWETLPPIEKGFYTRGVLRVLGVEGRGSQMPPDKRHELFIPEPLPGPNGHTKPRPRIPVPDAVVETFERIADDRKRLSRNQEHPFALQGRSREARAGELFYFDIAETPMADGRDQVSEISISAIWRRSVGDRARNRADSAYDFFDAMPGGADLTPLRPGKRAGLTPAELLFGVVDEAKEEGQVTARALASRLRVHDALALRQPQEAPAEVILKTLASPKPPSPALYFNRKDGSQPGRTIAKSALNKDAHRPNGRKFYLHHAAAGFEDPDPRHWPCVTGDPGEHDRMRLCCRPLLPEPDNPFYFHIDFDNLTDSELTLLLLALRPDADFCHKLGLGKPLGLGSVRIDVDGLFLVERHRRYGRDALGQPRYHRGWYRSDLPARPQWRQRYPREAAAIATGGEGWQQASTLEGHDWWNPGLIDHQALSVLRTLGDPKRLRPGVPVTTPLTSGQMAGTEQGRERETFRWFVANDKLDDEQRQALAPVEPDQPLPVLKAHPD